MSNQCNIRSVMNSVVCVVDTSTLLNVVTMTITSDSLFQMPGAPMPVTAYERPPYPAPHSFLALVVFTLIICLVLNITSLVIGIPALIFSVSVSSI